MVTQGLPHSSKAASEHEAMRMWLQKQGSRFQHALWSSSPPRAAASIALALDLEPYEFSPDWDPHEQCSHDLGRVCNQTTARCSADFTQ